MYCAISLFITDPQRQYARTEAHITEPSIDTIKEDLAVSLGHINSFKYPIDSFSIGILH